MHGAHVTLHVALVVEPCVTYFTGERLLARVDAQVVHEVGMAAEIFAAHLAYLNRTKYVR